MTVLGRVKIVYRSEIGKVAIFTGATSAGKLVKLEISHEEDPATFIRLNTFCWPYYETLLEINPVEIIRDDSPSELIQVDLYLASVLSVHSIDTHLRK